ncbi:MAG: hypothetical protein JKY31_00080 [Rhodobacteraceae bacterium]|nr:hypothetical protein [Paracoccaceae bacterium]
MKRFPKILSTLAVTLVATPVLAIDSCLTGSWSPDMEEFTDQFNTIPGAENVEITGEILMIFTDDSGSYLINDMIVDVQNPGAPRTVITMSGTSDFSVIADGGTFDFDLGEYEFSVSAELYLGGDEPMFIDTPFTDETAPMGGGVTGTYTCSGNNLSFQADNDGVIVENWIRQ